MVVDTNLSSRYIADNCKPICYHDENSLQNIYPKNERDCFLVLWMRKQVLYLYILQNSSISCKCIILTNLTVVCLISWDICVFLTTLHDHPTLIIFSCILLSYVDCSSIIIDKCWLRTRFGGGRSSSIWEAGSFKGPLGMSFPRRRLMAGTCSLVPFWNITINV